ncbi:LINE-1 retrotransposable element ORF2 protein [Dictyocoela muelleri]|nr:LINE-1 retrotransposable element ORF2 protein [Dictyocoela muelleri]
MMGSEFSKETLENEKHTKTLKTSERIKTTNTNCQKIKKTRTLMRNSIKEEDLLHLIYENQSQDGKMKRGGWAKVTAQYNLRNKTNYNQNSIRNFYILYLKEKDKRISILNNHIQNSQNSEIDEKNDENSIKNHDSKKVKNECKPSNEKKLKINQELKNLYNDLENIYLGLNINEMENWKRTPKVSSLLINYPILTQIDSVVEILVENHKISDICDIVKTIYASQLIYLEKTKRLPPKTNWINNINNKINTREKEALIVSKSIKEEPINLEEQKLLKTLIAKRRIKRKERENKISKTELREINLQIENEILLYKKKLEVHYNKKKSLRDNYLFECNRKCFYRELNNENCNILNNINENEISEFWNKQLGQKPQINNKELADIVSRTMKPMITNLELNLNDELINTVIEKLPNWKATGVDRIYNFFIKCIKSLRKPLIKEIKRLCENPSLIPEIFFQTLTYMIPKNNDPKPSEFRPISCMSNIYKIITKVLTINLYNILEVNNIISINQLGARKNTMASKEQVLFNHCINVIKDFKLKTVWFDIQKAYDTVPIEYISEILNTIHTPNNYLDLINRIKNSMKINLIFNNKKLCTISPKRGLIQGDSLSPLLFTLCMEPISRILNDQSNPKVEIKYKNVNMKVNHLVYMDDFKILAENTDDIIKLSGIFTETLNKLGMAHNKNKSCANTESCSEIADIISPLNGYKYLGLIEDGENRFKTINVTLLFDRICQRIEKLTNTYLNSKNLFSAFNEFALSLLNYFVGTINIPENMLNEWDTKIRKILIEKKIHLKTACKERLYLKRKNLGRGLNSLEFSYEKILLNTLTKIESKCNSCARNNLIKCVYENFTINEKELKEKPCKKYEIEENISINSLSLTAAFQMRLLTQIKKKEVHNKLFQEFENLSEIKDSAIWLIRGRLNPRTEGELCNIQDRNLFYDKKKCSHCNKSQASADHLATRCEKMLYYDYKKRHDEIQKVILISLLNKYTKIEVKHIKYQRTKNIYECDNIRIQVDIPIKTDIILNENRPDIVVIKKKEKKIYFVEIGVTNPENLKQVESWKKRKYELLAREYGRMMNMDVTVIPFVISWDGHVTSYNKKYREYLGITSDVFGYIQSLCLNKTLECIINKSEISEI